MNKRTFLAVTFLFTFSYLSFSQSSKKSSLKDFMIYANQLDSCGNIGIRKKVVEFFINKNNYKQTLKHEKDVYLWFGTPNKIEDGERNVVFWYVTESGFSNCMKYYPESVMESVSIFINRKNKKVTGFSPAIH